MLGWVVGLLCWNFLSHLNTCRVDDKSLKESRKIDDRLVLVHFLLLHGLSSVTRSGGNSWIKSNQVSRNVALNIPVLFPGPPPLLLQLVSLPHYRHLLADVEAELVAVNSVVVVDPEDNAIVDDPQLLLDVIKILGAPVESLLVLLALLGGRLVVRQGGGEDAGPVLHQELHHGEVVAGGRTVEGSPAVRVLGVHVAAEGDEELDDVEVTGTDGVVESRDALVVGGAGVGHLPGRLLHQVQLALQGGVQEEGQGVEADGPVVPGLTGDLDVSFLRHLDDALNSVLSVVDRRDGIKL